MPSAMQAHSDTIVNQQLPSQASGTSTKPLEQEVAVKYTGFLINERSEQQ